MVIVVGRGSSCRAHYAVDIEADWLSGLIRLDGVARVDCGDLADIYYAGITYLMG